MVSRIPRLRAGDFRHQLDLQSPPGLTGSRGEPGATWVDNTSGLWANIEALSGREGELARQKFPTATHKITLRYAANVAATMRLLNPLTNDAYHIEHYDDTGEYGVEHVIIATLQKA